MYLAAPLFYSLLASQFTYQNFGRSDYNFRQCAAVDLGTMTWLAMQCDVELDWICKIPKGTILDLLIYNQWKSFPFNSTLRMS